MSAGRKQLQGTHEETKKKSFCKCFLLASTFIATKLEKKENDSHYKICYHQTTTITASPVLTNKGTFKIVNLDL